MPVNFFKVEKSFISFAWFWPSPELMTKKEVLKIVLNTILMMTALTGEVSFAAANIHNDLPIALDALGPVASKFSVLLKVLALFYFRVEVMDLLRIFKRKMDEELNGCHSVTFIRPIKIANFATILLAGNIAITCIYYSILPIISILIGVIQGTPYEKHTPFKMLFPEILSPIATYECKYLLSMYACFIAFMGYVGVDGLFMGFCLHLSGHYKIIAKRIEELKNVFGHGNKIPFNHEEHSKCTPQENDQLNRSIVEIIESHVQVLDLTKRVSKLFQFIIFIHFVGAAIVIGMTSINFLLASWTAKLLYTNYMAGSFLHAYIYSATGEYLHDSTLEIMHNAYHFEWYKCDVRVQRSLQVMIRRSQYYTGIDVPFFETNLSTFTSILKTAGSYITLMNALL